LRGHIFKVFLGVCWGLELLGHMQVILWTIIQFFGFFFCETGVWTQVFVFIKQTLYRLSHTSSPFCSGYFGLRNYLPRLALNHYPPDLSLPRSRNERPCPASLNEYLDTVGVTLNKPSNLPWSRFL
jgi:hypothetical protein